MQQGRTINKIRMDRFTLRIENYQNKVRPFNRWLLWGCVSGFTVCMVIIIAAWIINPSEAVITPNIEQFVRAFYPWTIFKDFAPDHFVL